MNREYVIAGNWKMHKSGAEARELVRTLAGSFTAVPGLTVVVFPPFTALESVRGLDPKVRIGAQNVFYEEQGAYTGEIAPRMLAGLAEFVLVGHSERRQIFHESDADVGRKLRAVLGAGLKPVLCLGETLPERESGATLAKVDGQLDAGLAGVSAADWERVLVAYEPIWAIGTGRTATPQQAQEVHRHLRKRLEAKAPSRRVPVLYGGSVKPENSMDLLSQQDIDGLLVGGASLNAESFSAIILAGSQLLRS
ncbi:MAG TPA: triose-phosphate isomerase [Candidatus Aminicenantes bacterium]|nr:triose-phosphate isomerase [Candidatus Aminicenantes bacterium]